MNVPDDEGDYISVIHPDEYVSAADDDDAESQCSEEFGEDEVFVETQADGTKVSGH